MSVDLPAFLTVTEVAGLLRVSRMTVHRMIQHGEITAVRTGIGRGTYRIPASSLDEHLKRRTVITGSAIVPGQMEITA